MRYGMAMIACVTAGLASGSACAMTKIDRPKIECSVSGGAKLAAETGPDAICRAVRNALAGHSGTVRVQVTVESPFALRATIDTKGKTLPEEHLSISDSKLNQRAIDRFAERIAEVVTNAD
jgi:hypothetical protein